MSEHTHANPKREVVSYAITLAILLVLTFITVAVSYLDFGAGNVVIALAIATIKASLVGLIFMHLLHDKPIDGLILVAGFLLLALFLGFSAIDVDSRGNLEPANVKTPIAAPAKPPAKP
ncbi:MAG TPA: cytochrome C oxidase subunit IV family protein [Bryobacteraceae bacterium]|nr:cytochrome C oxidase subunit IV family protein [Bryobacteraceae bacterium]